MVEISLTCPPRQTTVKAGNSTDTLYVKAPAPSSTCQATITSLPGYNPINYVDISTQATICYSASFSLN